MRRNVFLQLHAEQMQPQNFHRTVTAKLKLLQQCVTKAPPARRVYLLKQMPIFYGKYLGSQEVDHNTTPVLLRKWLLLEFSSHCFKDNKFSFTLGKKMLQNVQQSPLNSKVFISEKKQMRYSFTETVLVADSSTRQCKRKGNKFSPFKLHWFFLRVLQ